MDFLFTFLAFGMSMFVLAFYLIHQRSRGKNIAVSLEFTFILFIALGIAQMYNSYHNDVIFPVSTPPMQEAWYSDVYVNITTNESVETTSCWAFQTWTTGFHNHTLDPESVFLDEYPSVGNRVYFYLNGTEREIWVSNALGMCVACALDLCLWFTLLCTYIIMLRYVIHDCVKTMSEGMTAIEFRSLLHSQWPRTHRCTQYGQGHLHEFSGVIILFTAIFADLAVIIRVETAFVQCQQEEQWIIHPVFVLSILYLALLVYLLITVWQAKRCIDIVLQFHLSKPELPLENKENYAAQAHIFKTGLFKLAVISVSCVLLDFIMLANLWLWDELLDTRDPTSYYRVWLARVDTHQIIELAFPWIIVFLVRIMSNERACLFSWSPPKHEHMRLLTGKDVQDMELIVESCPPRQTSQHDQIVSARDADVSYLQKQYALLEYNLYVMQQPRDPLLHDRELLRTTWLTEELSDTTRMDIKMCLDTCHNCFLYSPFRLLGIWNTHIAPWEVLLWVIHMTDFLAHNQRDRERGVTNFPAHNQQDREHGPMEDEMDDQTDSVNNDQINNGKKQTRETIDDDKETQDEPMDRIAQETNDKTRDRMSRETNDKTMDRIARETIESKEQTKETIDDEKKQTTRETGNEEIQDEPMERTEIRESATNSVRQELEKWKQVLMEWMIFNRPFIDGLQGHDALQTYLHGHDLFIEQGNSKQWQIYKKLQNLVRNSSANWLAWIRISTESFMRYHLASVFFPGLRESVALYMTLLQNEVDLVSSSCPWTLLSPESKLHCDFHVENMALLSSQLRAERRKLRQELEMTVLDSNVDSSETDLSACGILSLQQKTCPTLRQLHGFMNTFRICAWNKFLGRDIKSRMERSMREYPSVPCRWDAFCSDQQPVSLTASSSTFRLFMTIWELAWSVTYSLESDDEIINILMGAWRELTPGKVYVHLVRKLPQPETLAKIIAVVVAGFSHFGIDKWLVLHYRSLQCIGMSTQCSLQSFLDRERQWTREDKPLVEIWILVHIVFALSSAMNVLRCEPKDLFGHIQPIAGVSPDCNQQSVRGLVNTFFNTSLAQSKCDLCVDRHVLSSSYFSRKQWGLDVKLLRHCKEQATHWDEKQTQNLTTVWRQLWSMTPFEIAPLVDQKQMVLAALEEHSLSSVHILSLLGLDSSEGLEISLHKNTNMTICEFVHVNASRHTISFFLTRLWLSILTHAFHGFSLSHVFRLSTTLFHRREWHHWVHTD